MVLVIAPVATPLHRAQLREFLLSRVDQLPMTITKRLMMYALNREVEYFDMPYVREIVREAANDDYTFTSIVINLVNSDVFRIQGPEEKHDASDLAQNQR